MTSEPLSLRAPVWMDYFIAGMAFVIGLLFVLALGDQILISSFRDTGSARPGMAAAGVGFLGRASQPFPPARVSVERCELPQRVWGGAPAAQRFSYILIAVDRFT